MRVTTLATLLVLQCSELCLAIQVPVSWNNGEVPKDNRAANNEVSVETFTPQDAQKPVPVEYFEYTAKKPQFAVEVAASHGVHSPENLYKAYPVSPHTNVANPELGIHHILDRDKKIFHPLQAYVKNERLATPVSSNYEVFHPYKAEEPALQAIYKDPVLTKIRIDLENSKNRLQNYEQEAGKLDITKDEYKDRPDQTDKKLFLHKTTPVEFEIHRPQRKPVYYRPMVKKNQRDQVLNQRFKHPWNQNYIKIRPVHYRPLKKHIHNLRQHHALKYDDAKNEYPQIQVSQKTVDPQDGFDIYEKGKEKYIQLRNNLDETINKAVLENRPIVQQKLELQSDDTKESEEDEEEEDKFIPVKNYAQVRKTETVKHLPRAAAFKDADTYEDIQNAPRLREAVKSTKAQTVYTEEGYEDSAYDHAGEQKHASDHEGHSGYLKQKEISEGKYKIPSLDAGYTDAGGSAYKDQVQHGKKWKENNKDTQEETELEDYSEDEHEQIIGADTYNDSKSETNRNKRENDIKDETYLNVEKTFMDKHTNFKIPEINIKSTFLTEGELLSLAKEKKIELQTDDLKEKYPYYFKNIKSINKHSPLRYAENLKFIPKKSKGGIEFYESRDMLQCPEVGEVNPLPENLKNGENPTEGKEEDKETQSKGEDSFKNVKKQPRLRGLGDKIDCFKAKYFGENPLDNPFFKEEIIADPEPVTLPSSEIYKLRDTIELNAQESQSSKIFDKAENLSNHNESNIFILLDKLRIDQNNLQDTNVKPSKEMKVSLEPHQNYSSHATNNSAHKSNIYDILENIKKRNNLSSDINNKNISELIVNTQSDTASNNSNHFFQNKKEIMKPSSNPRKKRATPFIYEPYKIIKETQNEATKKINTLSNISPLIKQMQTSKVVDRVTRANQEHDKRQTSGRTYKDIGRNDRSKGTDKVNEESGDISFVNVNADQRRGEPKYEVKPANHKSEYTPVQNKRAMTVEDYKSQTNNKNNEENISQAPIQTRQNSRQRRPVFDVSRYLPIPTDAQNVAESNAVKKSVTANTANRDLQITIKPTLRTKESSEEVSSEEEYAEYEDEEDAIPITRTISTTTTTTSTTTTTQRTAPRRRRPTTTTTTTEKTVQEKNDDLEPPKLRLITRFRNYNQEHRLAPVEVTEKLVTEKLRTIIEDDPVTAPKYREKKKKSSKTTLVTDIKKYGDDFDNMKKEEVDTLIGVKHDMDEYKPEYEKEEEEKQKKESASSEESDEDFISSEENDDDDEDEDEEIDEEEEQDTKARATTPEPMKRTLIRTTDAPIPTISSRNPKPNEVKPIVSRKKVEIHNELPVNRASPHISQFKQDIKEEEVIKEMAPTPRIKPQKSIEALDLYKDDNLAKEINKLDDVEVFKMDLNLKSSPRHGGNYRSAEEPITTTQRTSRRKVPKDAEASQSENNKHVELDSHPPGRTHVGNLKLISDIPRSRNNGRSSKLLELSDGTEPPPRPMHGGNLRYDNKPKRGRGRSEKLIELDDNHHDDSTSRDRNNRKYGHSRAGHAMHGGNYRSEKIVGKSTDSEYDIRARKDKDVRRNAALLLNSFAQAVPILTTTPAYILDPSKRMYYYVEA